MKPITTLILFCAATAATAAPFPEGDAQAGQRLFEKHQCNRCHVKIVGGDGSAIFTRPDRKIRNAAQLLEQIRTCSANIGVTLTPREEQNLGAYLNRFYNLK